MNFIFKDFIYFSNQKYRTCNEHDTNKGFGSFAFNVNLQPTSHHEEMHCGPFSQDEWAFIKKAHPCP